MLYVVLCVTLLRDIWQGTNGSQLWDTAFAVNAMMETDVWYCEEFEQCLRKAHDYIRISQIAYNPPAYEKYYRHPNKVSIEVSDATKLFSFVSIYESLDLL